VQAKRRAVLLDRDGTLIVDGGYVGRPAAVELLPDAARALRVLAHAGLALVVLTNQSGVYRGYFSLEDVHAVNLRVAELLGAYGVELAGFYVCPHDPMKVARAANRGLRSRIVRRTSSV
jgi:D-glycero-D-manno-heptose 1,7-bisphosphate phosphatase